MSSGASNDFWCCTVLLWLLGPLKFEWTQVFWNCLNDTDAKEFSGKCDFSHLHHTMFACFFPFLFRCAPSFFTIYLSLMYSQFTWFNICLDNSTLEIFATHKNVRIHCLRSFENLQTGHIHEFRVQIRRVKWILLKIKRYESKLDFIAFVGSFSASS